MLTGLDKLTWPRERRSIVVVDNGSHPGFTEEVHARFPSVRVIGAGRNLGFGGGCNLGIAATNTCDFVAIMNNDTTPSPDFLEPLIDLLHRRPHAGAAAPKVLLESRYVVVDICSPVSVPGAGDTRDLGVQICGARVDGADVSDRIELVEGLWGWEQDFGTFNGPFSWTRDRARILVPVDGASPPVGATHAVSLRLASGIGPKVVSLAASARQQDRVLQVTADPTWFDVTSEAASVDVINSVGTELLEDGSAADRGFLHPDAAQLDTEQEVFGWSGAAVVLRRKYLDDVGPFDDRFFLYYEDTELSWRGRLLGWSHWVAPTAVVRHDHSASVGARSSLVQHLVRRNRLLVLTMRAPRKIAVRAVATALADVRRAVRRDVFARVGRGRRPILKHVAFEARILGGYARLAPGAIADRLRVRRVARVDDREILEWARSSSGEL